MNALSTTRRRALALAPLLAWGAVGALILSCGGLIEEECVPGDACYFGPELSPEEQRVVNDGRAALLGTWAIEHLNEGRDDVGRPIEGARARFELEIFEVELQSAYQGAQLVSWRGALRAKSMCVATADPDAPCEEFEATSLGQCSGHTCDRYPEREMEGTYDLKDDRFSFGSSFNPAGMYTASADRGYINLRGYLDGDIYIGQGNTPAPCEGFCDWGITPAGLYTDTFDDRSGDAHTRTFLPISKAHRTDGLVDEQVQVVPIDSVDPVAEKLQGDWLVRMTLGSLDDVDRPVDAGYAEYTLDLFEVVEASPVGLWGVHGALRGVRLCLVPQARAAAGDYTCDLYEPTPIGSCDAADCEERGEVAIEGTFDAMRNLLTLDDARAPVFYLDPASGFLAASLYVNIQDAELPVDEVAPTICQGIWCDWSVRPAGAFEDTYSSQWPSEELRFSMKKQR